MGFEKIIVGRDLNCWYGRGSLVRKKILVFLELNWEVQARRGSCLKYQRGHHYCFLSNCQYHSKANLSPLTHWRHTKTAKEEASWRHADSILVSEINSKQLCCFYNGRIGRKVCTNLNLSVWDCYIFQKSSSFSWLISVIMGRISSLCRRFLAT